MRRAGAALLLVAVLALLVPAAEPRGSKAASSKARVDGTQRGQRPPPPPEKPPASQGRGRNSGKGGRRSRRSDGRVATGKKATGSKPPPPPKQQPRGGASKAANSTRRGDGWDNVGPAAAGHVTVAESAGLPPLVEPMTGRGAGDASFITAKPPYLDFGTRPLCIPAMGSLRLKADGRKLEIRSIKSDSVHMHPAFFKAQTLKSDATVQVRIIFLPRSLGPVEGNLVLDTSVGRFLYQVLGEGAPNPYGLGPFIAPRIAVGALYNPPIKVRNPTAQQLRVREVFTTESFLHLALPPEVSAASDPFDEDDGEGAGAGGTEANQIAGGTAGDGRHDITSESTMPAGLWLVDPHAEKEVIKMAFKSHSPGHFTGYVHVKTDRDNMVLPVELTVLKGGLHPSPSVLDFGVVSAGRPTTTMHVSFVNSGPAPLTILSAAPEPFDAHLSVMVLHDTIQPGEEVADALRVSFVVQSNRPWVAGKLVLQTNDTNPVNALLELRYMAVVVNGRVAFDVHSSQFDVFPPAVDCDWLSDSEGVKIEGVILGLHQGQQLMRDEPHARKFTLHNSFQVPIMLTSAAVGALDGDEDAASLFSVTSFPTGATAAPDVAWEDAEVTFTPHANMTAAGAAQLRLQSNLSTFDIPLVFSHGRLAVVVERFNPGGVELLDAAGRIPRGQRPGPGAMCWEISTAQKQREDSVGMLEFGRIAIGERRTLHAYLTNVNPTPVVVRSIEAMGKGLSAHFVRMEPAENMPKTVAGYRASWRWEAAEFLRTVQAEEEDRSMTVIPPGYVALLAVTVVATGEKGPGGVSVQTHTETITFRVSHEPEAGALRLSPSLVRFEPSFPGKHRSQSLAVMSTFDRPVQLLSLKAAHSFMKVVKVATTLHPRKLTQVGYIMHDVAHACGAPFAPPAPGAPVVPDDEAAAPAWDCMRKRLHMPAWMKLKKFSKFGTALRKSDAELVKQREKEWMQLKQIGRASVSTNVVLSSEVGDVVVPVQGKLVLPSLFVSKNGRMEFPLMQVGQVASNTIVVRNPSDVAVRVQLVALRNSGVETGPQPPASWSAASDAAGSNNSASGEHSTSDIAFYLHRGDGSSEPKLLAPGEKVFLGPLEFRPSGIANASCTLFLRNNLTGMERLSVMAAGGSGLLRLRPLQGVAIRKSGQPCRSASCSDQNATLVFEVNVTHMRRPSGHRVPILMHTLKLRAENRGNMPLQVQSFDIGGAGCRAFGFEVHGCSKTPFEIRPKTARTVRISFVPDCSSSFVRHELVMRTNLGVRRYGLEASILPEVLPLCEQQLGKRGQANITELTLRYGAILVCLLVFLLVVCKDIMWQ
eukprot:g1611.t1